jgi:hypothetical protein
MTFCTCRQKRAVFFAGANNSISPDAIENSAKKLNRILSKFDSGVMKMLAFTEKMHFPGKATSLSI